MSDSTRYVRLKPYNKKVGHVVKRYHVAGQLFIGEDQSGNPKWYKVDKTVAAMLEKKRQNPNDPNGIKLFDVATKAEYEATSLRERDLRLVEMGLASASAIASGPTHQAEAPLIDRSSGRGGAVPGDEIPSAAKEAAPVIKVEEIGPSSGEPVATPPVREPSDPSGAVDQSAAPAADASHVTTPEPESPIDPPHPAEAAGEPEPAAASEEPPTSRRRRPSGG